MAAGRPAPLPAVEPTSTFTGFFDPVNNEPVLNVAHAGDAISMRFTLGGDRGLGILGKVTTSKAQARCNIPTGLRRP